MTVKELKAAIASLEKIAALRRCPVTGTVRSAIEELRQLHIKIMLKEIDVCDGKQGCKQILRTWSDHLDGCHDA